MSARTTGPVLGSLSEDIAAWGRPAGHREHPRQDRFPLGDLPGILDQFSAWLREHPAAAAAIHRVAYIGPPPAYRAVECLSDVRVETRPDDITGLLAVADALGVAVFGVRRLRGERLSAQAGPPVLVGGGRAGDCWSMTVRCRVSELVQQRAHAMTAGGLLALDHVRDLAVPVPPRRRGGAS